MPLQEYQLDHAAFDLWLMGEGEDNRAELDKVKRILPIVLEECCSPVQKKYIMHYFVDGMSMPQIAVMYDLATSTVCRTINRGLTRAYKALRFVSPLFIKQPQRRGYMTWGGGMPIREEIDHE